MARLTGARPSACFCGTASRPSTRRPASASPRARTARRGPSRVAGPPARSGTASVTGDRCSRQRPSSDPLRFGGRITLPTVSQALRRAYSASIPRPSLSFPVFSTTTSPGHPGERQRERPSRRRCRHLERRACERRPAGRRRPGYRRHVRTCAASSWRRRRSDCAPGSDTPT